MSRPKGVPGGCCCGSCMSPPGDSRIVGGSVQKTLEIHQYCCRCVPNYICVTASQAGVSGINHYLFPHRRNCGDISYSGDPIQYAGTITANSGNQQLNIRLAVSGTGCYIKWDLPNLGYTGVKFIDPNIPPTGCNHNLKPKACAEFGFSATGVAGTGNYLSSDLYLTANEPQTLEIKNVFECAGCNCICKCMCVSVLTRPSGQALYTVGSSSDIICADPTQVYSTGCGISNFSHTPWIAGWTNSSGWNIQLTDSSEFPPNSGTLVSGVSTYSSPCSLTDAVKFGDSYNHKVSGQNSAFIYDFDVGNRIAKSYKWVGLTHNDTEVLSISGYNWVTPAWTSLANVNGRPSGIDINAVSASTLTSAYTGTGSDKGKVRLKFQTTGTDIKTDMLRVVCSECCALSLTPPSNITPSTPLSKIVLTGSNSCPTPSPRWNFNDTSGNYHIVTAECSWCGGLCGSNISSTCCNRVLPNYLFAEVSISCATGCVGTPFTVLLDSNYTYSLWQGSNSQCGVDGGFALSVTCGSGSTGWIANVTNTAGGCTLSGGPIQSSSAICDPLNVQFAGTLAGGLGCCGPLMPYDVTPGITITVIE